MPCQAQHMVLPIQVVKMTSQFWFFSVDKIEAQHMVLAIQVVTMTSQFWLPSGQQRREWGVDSFVTMTRNVLM